jgi:hypothetical protein
MRKALIIFLALVTTSVFSRDLLRSWECDNLKVHMYNDDTFQVGDLIYDIEYYEDSLLLKIDDMVLLIVSKRNNEDILIINNNNLNDFKYFVKCN